MVRRLDKISINRLKGISVYLENDLYEYALLMLKLIDARQKYEKSNAKSRPTACGLAHGFAAMINRLEPDYDLVLKVIKKHKLPLNATIEYDTDI